jgi:hypothetical protein
MVERRTSALLSTLEKGTDGIDTALNVAEALPALETEVLFNLDCVCFAGFALRVHICRITLEQYPQLSHALVETQNAASFAFCLSLPTFC